MNKKLVKCKTCGADIAKNAKACPSCGAKNQVIHPVRGAIGGVVMLIICIGVIFPLLNPDALSEQVNGSGASPSEIETIQISASDLWKAYSDNKVNADNLYKGQMLSVTGTVGDITQDILTKSPCVMLETGNQFGLYAIQCFFDDNGDGNLDVAALSDGQSVTIVGKCDGVPVSSVQISHCNLSE